MKIKIAGLFTFLISWGTIGYPQHNPCDLDPFCDDTDYVEEVPLDGGVAFLVATGIVYGMRQFRQVKNKDPRYF